MQTRPRHADALRAGGDKDYLPAGIPDIRHDLYQTMAFSYIQMSGGIRQSRAPYLYNYPFFVFKARQCNYFFPFFVEI